jgi:hypothetical protein
MHASLLSQTSGGSLPMSDREHSAGEDGERRGYAVVAVLGLLLVLAIGCLPFVPLLLAAGESLTFGTQRVEDFCRYIGIHEELSALYETVLPWFK